jgi:fluoride exporter
MNELRNLLAVMVGGGLGSAARYAIGVFFIQRFGPGFPYGTLFINVAGCFIIGVIMQMAQTRVAGISPVVRLFLAVGFTGGFTTFSTFAYESLTLAGGGATALAILYVCLSVVAGVLAVFAGAGLARLAGG